MTRRRTLQPAEVVHGLELYECTPMKARMTVAQCDRNRQIAECTPRKGRGGTVGRAAKALHTRRSKPPQDDPDLGLSRDSLIRDRRSHCAGCPGVLDLARRAARRAARHRP